ncbi:MAG: serine/threonine protein kinase [Planctomycetes bacterium]|nr:serine/threonine protein kinase [Planctomycetota bacterium]
MIPTFQRTRDRELGERLLALCPVLEGPLEAVDSAIGLLMDEGVLERDDYRRALPAPDSLRPLSWGPFSVFEELGRGAAGIVYRASLGGDPCALKILRELPQMSAEGEARFRREVEVLERLDHPGIARLVRAGVEDGVLFHATEFVRGGSLGDFKRRGRGSPARAIFVAQGCAAALQHAHERGVVHRDLKPDNVLLDRGGLPRLVDFGLAKDLWGESLTRSQAFLGTALYAAPEQMVWAKDCNDLADVYGLGGVLHFALTGGPPYPARTIGELYVKVSAGFQPLHALPGVPGSALGEVNDLLERALRPQVSDRLSLSSFRERLETLAELPGLRREKSA